MKLFLADYQPKEPFDREDCETCEFNPVEDERTICTNSKSIHYITHNVKCGVYHERQISRAAKTKET